MRQLPEEIDSARKHIEKLAKDYGLDFFPVSFEMVTYNQINAFAAYGGFPTRYPHWSFGMQYEQLSKSYEYGLSKIYEMVINTDPVYAYLMEGNMHVDQKMVMAHVFGHADFFKNNKWFEPTNRKMMDVMANHATRIREYNDRFGQDVVEAFIDKIMSIDNLIDRYSPYTKKNNDDEKRREIERVRSHQADNQHSNDYLSTIRQETPSDRQILKYPSRPEKDILEFLINFAPLEEWQRDIIGMVRKESYYFAPQGMTKIMNEGWASYWHTKMMTSDLLEDSELVCYADHHAGAVSMHPMGFNPYKIGLELFRDIEDRWNKGQFGKDWNDCNDVGEKKNWDKKLGLGRKKIFEVRRDYNDVTFIDEFLTEDFCIRNKMFVYRQDQKTGKLVVDTREFHKTKKQLLFQLTNWGQPIIHVENGNHENRGELLLTHLHEGVDMQPDYMKETMKAIAYVWGRPVNIKTIMENDEQIFRWDGKEHTSTKTGESKPPSDLG
jgi:stage V sporulation protein R